LTVDSGQLVVISSHAKLFVYIDYHCRVRSQRTATHKYKLWQFANIQLILPRYLLLAERVVELQPAVAHPK